MKKTSNKKLNVPSNSYEKYFIEKGFKIVCGLDEVGRGSWAGPLVAGAVILNQKLYGLRDSKLLSAKDREKLAKKIWKTSKVGIGEVSVKELNKLKLTKGTQLAFRRAVRAIKLKPNYILSDGFRYISPIPCRAIIKGDRICSSIAAASIVAKVYRDEIMRQLDKEIKGYEFNKHKGYGTRLHQNRLKKLGFSKAHRIFYSGVKTPKYHS